MITKEARRAAHDSRAQERGKGMITKEAIEAGAIAGDVPDYKAEQILTAAFAAMPGPAVKVKPLGKEFDQR